METECFGSPWEELKRRLFEELTPEELKIVLFLMAEKLGTHYEVLRSSENPMDLFIFLEDNFTEFDAMVILKHVLGAVGYYPQFSNHSFEDIIEVYEQKTREAEESFKIYRDANFIGRRKEMVVIQKSLSSDMKGLWLCGQGGMGKTTLANEVCYRYYMNRNVHTVNVNLKGKDMAADVARETLMAMQEYSTTSDPDMLFSQSVTSVQQLAETGTETIILLDSIEDSLQKDRERTCTLLVKLLQGLPLTVKLLVTSRTEIQKFPSLQPIDSLDLQPFPYEDAVKLLRKTVRPIQLSESECTSVLNFCGNSPLAIRVISRTIQGYYQEHTKLTIEQILNIAQKSGTMAEVLDVIKYSYDSLDERHKKYLLTLSVFENSMFETDEVAFMTQLSPKDAILLLLFLKYKNLVEIEQTILQKGGTRFLYFLHPLVLTFLNHLVKPTDIKHLYLELMLKKIGNVENTHNERFVEAFSVFRDRTASIKTLFLYLQQEPRSFSIMRFSYLYKLSVFFGSPASREGLLEGLAKEHESKGLKTSALYWTVVTATSCIDDNRFDEAERHLEKIREEIETIQTSDNNLLYVQGEYFLTQGRIYNNKDKYTAAEEALCKARNCFQPSEDSKSRFPEVARTYNALGNIYFKMRNYGQSLIYHQKASGLMQKHLVDPNNQELSVYVFNLGTVKAQQAENKRDSDRELANELYQGALGDFNTSMEIDVRLNLQRIPSYTEKLLSRSDLHHRMGKYDEAIADAKEAVKLREDIYGENHSLVTNAYYCVASLLYKRSSNKQDGTKESRKDLLKQAYAICIDIEKQTRQIGRAHV